MTAGWEFAWAASFVGLLIGSFLNVCIYRLPRDLSVTYPERSFCPRCNRLIRSWENIPVLSWLLLRARCPGCQGRISWRYPAIELLTGALFFSAAAQYGFSGTALRAMVFSSILTVLFFTDLETRILPDEFTVGGAAAGWAMSLAFPMSGGLISLFLPESASVAGRSLANSVLGAALPALGFWAIGEIYLRVRHREGLGFGDVKMLLTLGAFTGLEGALLTVIAASVAGSAFGLTMIALRGRGAAQYELPFGSFLAAAALLLVHAGTVARIYLDWELP